MAIDRKTLPTAQEAKQRVRNARKEEVLSSIWRAIDKGETYCEVSFLIPTPLKTYLENHGYIVEGADIDWSNPQPLPKPVQGDTEL